MEYYCHYGRTWILYSLLEVIPTWLLWAMVNKLLFIMELTIPCKNKPYSEAQGQQWTQRLLMKIFL